MPTAGIVTQTKATQLYLDGWLGQYSLGLTTGVVAAATVGEIFQFRWVDATRICAIQRVAIEVIAQAGADLLSNLQLDLIKATSWGGQGTGGTAIDMTAGTNKRRTSMPTTLVASGDVRVATTAALGAGTKSLEANSLASLQASGSANPMLSYTRMIETRQGDGEYPLVLASTEGFVVKAIADIATAWVASIEVDWLETAAS